MAESTRLRGERLQIMLNPEELVVLDDFRFKQRMPSRAAAVRELLKRGLAAEGFAVAAIGTKSAEYGVTGKTPVVGNNSRRHIDRSGAGENRDMFGARAALYAARQCKRVHQSAQVGPRATAALQIPDKARPGAGRRRPLLLGNAGALDHRGPLLDVAFEPRLQFLGRAGLGLDAEFGVALLHVGHRDDLADRLVEQVDDRRRRADRREHAVPRRHLVAGNRRPPRPSARPAGTASASGRRWPTRPKLLVGAASAFIGA